MAFYRFLFNNEKKFLLKKNTFIFCKCTTFCFATVNTNRIAIEFRLVVVIRFVYYFYFLLYFFCQKKDCQTNQLLKQKMYVFLHNHIYIFFKNNDSFRNRILLSIIIHRQFDTHINRSIYSFRLRERVKKPYNF